MVKEKLVEKWLDETDHQKISIVWLDLALRATNDNGCISQEIEENQYFKSEYPDIVQEIQHWLAKIIVSKRFSVIPQLKVRKKILRVIRELESSPDDLIKIFYKYRYLFKKHKNESQINNDEQTF